MSDDYYVDEVDETHNDFMVVKEDFIELNEDNEFKEEIPDYTDEDGDYMNSHLVMQRQNEDGNEVYHCLQCDVEYTSLEDFADAHTANTENEINVGDGVDESEQPWDVLEDTNNEKCIVNEDEFVDGLIEEDFGGMTKEEITAKCEEGTNIILDSDDNTFFCCDCHSIFGSMELAEAHDCTGTGLPAESTTAQPVENTFTCDMCPKQFKSLKALVAHKRCHSKLKGPDISYTLPMQEIVCEICNTIFASEKNLKAHMKMHMQSRTKSIGDVLPEFAKTQYNELNQFHCEICNKSFEQNLLEIHRNMHKNLEEYTCQVCNKKFENLPSFEVHLQMHKDVNERAPRKRPHTQERLANAKVVYPCQYCGHVFARPFEKVKHERVHTGEKPYACEVCGKTFRVSYSLTLHLRTHTDIRPYVCPTCNKRFKAHSVYSHHLKTHQMERSYKCDSCSKAYRTSVQLNSHKKSHLKPYSCPDCNRPFSSMYSVKIHMKTHNKANKSNEQLKHRCHLCGAVYARLFALRYHLRDQHADVMGGAADGQNDLHLDENTAGDGEENDNTEPPNVELLLDDNEAVLIAAAAEADSVQYSYQDGVENTESDEDGAGHSGVTDKLEMYDWQ